MEPNDETPEQYCPKELLVEHDLRFFLLRDHQYGYGEKNTKSWSLQLAFNYGYVGITQTLGGQRRSAIALRCDK